MTQNNVNTAIDGYSDFLKITEERGYALYRAYDEAHHRQVVLRVFKRNLHDEQTLRQACADELRALMRLIHPNIVSTVGYGLWRHNLYAVNVQTQGLSLQQWVREERLQWVDKYQIAIELLRAMQHAHRNQIIHGDIHATHVIVDTKKKPHLTGFCLHALCDQLEDSVNLVGGDRYVYWAPERRDDARLFTRATDVYALGVLFYFLFMGDLPSDGDVLDVLQESDLNTSLRRMMRRMLSRDPHQRLIDCEATIRVLQRLAISAGAHGDEAESELIHRVLPAERFAYLDAVCDFTNEMTYLYEDRIRKSLMSVRCLPANATGIEAAQRLEGVLHPHVVRVVAVATLLEKYAVVTEYQSGGTLMSRIAHAWSISDSLAFAEQMLSALAHVRERHVIHGNVRPWHIFFDEFGSPALTHFSMAQKELDAELERGYVVPGEPCSEQSDLFALGAIVYELIAGERPHFMGSVLSPHPRFKAVKSEVRAVLESLLQIEPHDRVRNASTALYNLQSAMGKLPPQSELIEAEEAVSDLEAVYEKMIETTSFWERCEQGGKWIVARFRGKRALLLFVVVLFVMINWVGIVMWKAGH